MATQSLAKGKTGSAEYQLPEAVRRQMLQESTSRPDAVIPASKLQVVERQRLRFIEHFGSDGCSESD